MGTQMVPGPGPWRQCRATVVTGDSDDEFAGSAAGYWDPFGHFHPAGTAQIQVNPGAGPDAIVAALHLWAARNGGAGAVLRAIGRPA